jgi:hypothetical protein
MHDILNVNQFDHKLLTNYLCDAYQILAESYNDLLKEKVYYVGDYNENKFRDDLVRIAESKPKNCPYRWHTESRNLERNSRIDIAIIYSLEVPTNDYDLTIECKVLSNNTKNDDYINRNGIISFANEKYSKYLPLAGMMGFITEGKITEIVKDINLRLKNNTHITTLCDLQTYELYKESKNVYLSIHKKSPSKNEIKIYHLFLLFEDIIG